MRSAFSYTSTIVYLIILNFTLVNQFDWAILTPSQCNVFFITSISDILLKMLRDKYVIFYTCVVPSSDSSPSSDQNSFTMAIVRLSVCENSALSVK